ncbi:MAG: SWIM zinc finger family protein, partial [Microbacteriaceae bacterium]|nr:SWIM zinc finger family protein [Microbacteriaceae bacterium]
MPHESFPLIDVSEIIRLVGQAALQRGRDYARLGAVLKTEWDGPTRRVLGTVQGSGTVPYRCSVTLVVARESPRAVNASIGAPTSKPTSSTCSCPMAFDCKHIAATLIANNSLHIRELNSSAVAPARAFTTGPNGAAKSADGVQTPPTATELPTWKTAVAVFASDDEVSAATSGMQPDVGGYRPIGYRPAPPTAMGLLFELRGQTPRTADRWRGPSAKTATKNSGDSPTQTFRLGVRPVIKSSTGNWVRGNVSWNSLSYLSNRLNLRPDQLRWFAQFAALHRATREVFTTQEPDWLYLDDFLSPLLWQLLAQAETIGITLIGGKKDASVVVAQRAELSIDVTAAVHEQAIPETAVPKNSAAVEEPGAPNAP